MKPDARLMAAIISAIDTYIQAEQGRSSPSSVQPNPAPSSVDTK